MSAGGTCRLLRAGDGRWLAMNLARRSDVELLAAWMERDWTGAPWDAVASALEAMTADAAVERAQLLGVPAAVAVPPPPSESSQAPEGAPLSTRQSLVVDLSALWAGPLCARLLGTRGMTVVKVEHASRPDGARSGPPEFWARLNGAKSDLVLDLDSPAGRTTLHDLLDDAAVVVTSARPRAIDQLGFGLRERVRDRGLVWVSITGYGLEGAWRDRVAFGDDAAVAGGLAVLAGGADSPVFVGDAPADPLAGMTGAVVATRCIECGVGGIVDVSMRDAIASAIIEEGYPATSQQEVA